MRALPQQSSRFLIASADLISCARPWRTVLRTTWCCGSTAMEVVSSQTVFEFWVTRSPNWMSYTSTTAHDLAKYCRAWNLLSPEESRFFGRKESNEDSPMPSAMAFGAWPTAARDASHSLQAQAKWTGPGRRICQEPFDSQYMPHTLWPTNVI